MELHPFTTEHYLRIGYRLPGTVRIRSIAAVRVTDGRCFIDEPSLFLKLREICQGNPFAALFPNECPWTLRAFQTPNYLRLTYTLPGESWGRPIAAVRVSDGYCFVDEPAIFEQVRERCAGNPFEILFPGQPTSQSPEVPGPQPLRARDGGVDSGDQSFEAPGSDGAYLGRTGAIAGFWGDVDESDRDQEEELEVDDDLSYLDPIEDAEAPIDDGDSWDWEWAEEWEQEVQGWHDDLEEAQDQEAYWQDSDYN